MKSHRLFVLHIQEGTEAGTDAWFHNSAAQVSSNFGNPLTGRPDQWVDTDDRAWAQMAYNDVAISVENEGDSGDSLNANQLENAAQILAWAHTTHGTKLQVTDDPDGEGVIGHGQLGVAGGDHPDCPGAPILAQRQQIVDRAKQILGQPVDPTPTPASNELVVDGMLGRKTITKWQEVMGTPADGIISTPSSELVRAVQKFLNARIGAGLVVDGAGIMQDGRRYYTVAALQRYLGTIDDGIMSVPVSRVVMALQRRLNQNRF
jgi:hypothetical protein